VLVGRRRKVGNRKKQRTEHVKEIGRRIILSGQASNAIEQHNFDKLVRRGIIVREK